MPDIVLRIIIGVIGTGFVQMIIAFATALNTEENVNK